MRYPEPYIEYLAHFHGSRDYFECHELLEDYWKKEHDPVMKSLWHGLIQLAVSAYHERRGNRKGAAKMLEAGMARLSGPEVRLAGLDPAELQLRMAARLEALRDSGAERSYTDPELPFADPELLEESRKLAASWGFVWNRPSPLGDRDLLDRHTLRDRSDVISARAASLREKRQGEPSGEEEA